MAAGFLVRQILKHGRKKGTQKAKDFLNFVKTGKYKDKTGKVTDTNKKIKKNELDLQTMQSPTKKKMAKGGIMEPYYGSFISGTVDGKKLSNPSYKKYYGSLLRGFK
jgi:hypothetical protein